MVKYRQKSDVNTKNQNQKIFMYVFMYICICSADNVSFVRTAKQINKKSLNLIKYSLFSFWEHNRDLISLG